MQHRCHLEGLFQRELFPEYTSGYPIVLVDHNQPAATATKERREQTTTTMTDNQSGADGHTSTSLTSGTRVKPAQPGLATSSSNNNSDHGNNRVVTRSAKSVGSINLRVGVTKTAAPRVGGDGTTPDAGGVVGEEDGREIKRRRTNKVTRRVRLWVRWVSFARLLREFTAATAVSDDLKTSTSTVNQDKSVLEGRGNSREEFRGTGTRDVRTCSRAGQTNASETKHHDMKAAPNPVSSASPLAMTAIPVVGVWCRISWRGVRVATFQISPQTGVPITPGECLLSLPRGAAWNSCCLVLEVLATDQFMQQYPGFKHAQATRRCDDVQCRGGSVQNDESVKPVDDDERDTGRTTGDTIGDKQTDDEEGRGGRYTLLGKSVVDWQVRRHLREGFVCVQCRIRTVVL